MKKLFIFLLLQSLTFIAFSQKKSGITNFSISGKDRQLNVTSDQNEDLPDLYFIYDKSTRLGEGLLTDSLVRYTEASLGQYFGYSLVPASLTRSANVPEQTDGTLWAMSSISDKAAKEKLGYDEIIKVTTRISLGGKKNNQVYPTIEITIKVEDKDGKTAFKKSEKLKLKDELIPESDLILDNSIGAVSISLSKKSVKVESDNNNEGPGIPAARLLDWYQQCLENLLAAKE